MMIGAAVCRMLLVAQKRAVGAGKIRKEPVIFGVDKAAGNPDMVAGNLDCRAE